MTVSFPEGMLLFLNRAGSAFGSPAGFLLCRSWLLEALVVLTIFVSTSMLEGYGGFFEQAVGAI